MIRSSTARRYLSRLRRRRLGTIYALSAHRRERMVWELQRRRLLTRIQELELRVAQEVSLRYDSPMGMRLARFEAIRDSGQSPVDTNHQPGLIVVR